MSLTLSARDTMLNALTITKISAHTGFPGSTGASEVAGGTYAKVSVSFSASSGGQRAMSSSSSFNIPAATIVRWLGLWSGSTFLGYSPNAGNPKEFIADPATSIITSLAHGYVDTNKVTIYGDTMPTGLTEGSVYFVVNSTANTFQLAATSGGVPLALTSGGGSGCVVSGITEELYAVAGTHTISSWILGLPN